MAGYVTVIGAVNVDIIGRSDNKIIYKNSNIGRTKISYGGVGRNIAENLSRLNVKVELITALGDDENALGAIKNCEENGISLKHSLRVLGGRTSTYMCINDESGDMLLGINDMAIYEKLTVDYIKTKLDVINRGDLLIFDANSSKEVAEFLAENVTVPIVADTVSQSKTERLKGALPKITILKPNIFEAEILTGETIKTDGDIELAAQRLTEIGVKKVFISCAERGVYYKSGAECGFLSAKKTEIKSTTGAGDAFVAALCYSELKGYGAKRSALLGTCAAALTLNSENAVSLDMSETNLLKILGE